jgi:hypothetical protein
MKTFLLIFLSAFCCTAQPISNAAREYKVLDGLVGWWKFDDVYLGATTCPDRSGSGNTLTLENSPATSAGKVGQSLSFNAGSTLNQYANVNNQLIGTGTVTVTAWINPSGWGESGRGYICASIDSGLVEFGLFISSSYGGAFNTVYVFSDNASSSVLNAPNNSIVLNQWQFVCVIRNSDGTGSIYINGALVASGATSPTAASTSFDIGNRTSDMARAFQGQIDDVRVYNRALSPFEIHALAGQ